MYATTDRPTDRSPQQQQQQQHLMSTPLTFSFYVHFSFHVLPAPLGTQPAASCRKLGLDLVPRLGTLAVDPHKIGIVSLHQVHVNSAENAKAASVSGTFLEPHDQSIII